MEFNSQDAPRDARILPVKSMDDLTAALFYKPKVFVLNTFNDSTKDGRIISEIKSKSPDSKIILYGASKAKMKSSQLRNVEEVIESSVSLKGLVIAIEKVIFSASYNESFLEDIQVPAKSNGFMTVFLAIGLVIVLSLVYFLFDFF